jgi:hypothetical protein
MNYPILGLALVLTIPLMVSRGESAAALLPSPPQELGLPYTRSAREAGREVLRPYLAALFVTPEFSSRYAYVTGLPVRLDDEDVLAGEPWLKDGEVYVPVSFAGVLMNREPKFGPVPEYLQERWIYEVARGPYLPAAGIGKAERRGRLYVSLRDVVAEAGLHLYRDASGLVLVSTSPVKTAPEGSRLETVITLFDTPDKLAAPGIAMRSIPTLTRQGDWRDRVKAPDEQQLAALAGPETEWAFTPVEAFDFSGFDAKALGSPVPEPGVYPRLLFSPEDTAEIYRRMRSQITGQRALIEWEVMFAKNWWNPGTSDGQIFQKLADPVAYKSLEWPLNQVSPGAGVVRSLFAGQKPGIRSSHVNYNTNSLTSMALFCLLSGDEANGARVAAAIANYYRLLEPELDAHLATSDSEFGVGFDAANNGATAWRGMHALVAHMDLAFALDFAGKWMSAADRDFMRRFIAKATYGRRDNMQAAPVRVRDINHLTWHFTNFLAVSAIEGLEGADPEVLAAGRESVRAFCEWGLDASGQMFESNGKSGGGIQFHLLAMNVLARRGLNLWGHPHWRKLPEAQAQITSPDGGATISSGTWGGSRFATNAFLFFRTFYPGDRAAELLLAQANPGALDFDPAAYRAKLEKSFGGTRLPGPTYPGFVFTGLYDNDWDRGITREQTGLPLDFHTDDYGLLATRSDHGPQAAWLALHGRTNQYIGSGHHHADVGMIYFSALGVNWITERTQDPYANTYDGRYHNLVLVDGVSQPDGVPARGRWLGAALRPEAAFAAVDQTRSYSWRWTNQITTWDARGGSVWETSAATPGWELETDDELMLQVYKGTQHWKSRPWWPTYTFSNWIPVLRAPHNPVMHAIRTAGLVRGDRGYGLVVDDVKKDEATRFYEWTAMTGPGIGAVERTGLRNDEVLLARVADMDEGRPRPGAPLLLVRALAPEGLVAAQFEKQLTGPKDRKGVAATFDRVSLALRDTEARFRVLLLPVRAGETQPVVAYDARAEEATISWPDGVTETIRFERPDGATRTAFEIKRADRVVGVSP